MKVVISDCSWNAYDVEKAALPADWEVVCAQVDHEDEDALIKVLKDADGAMSEYCHYTRKVMEACPKLRIISDSSMGTDNIDLAAAKDLGIAVANAPRYCIHEVAEHIAAMVLSILRYIPGYDRSVKEDKVWDFTAAPKLYRIEGMTVGLIGCGRIATMAVNYLKGFNFRVVGVDPYLPKEVAEANGIELFETREQVAEAADIVISHIPVIKSEDDKVDARFFNACKKNPIFINMARGASVNYDDLTEALKNGQIRWAGLDVVDTEPADLTKEIFSLPNVTFSPHAAFYSETALVECRTQSAENIKNYLAGDKSRVFYVVDPAK